MNSINWARIMAQTVYYFTAAAALGSPHRRVSFAVPTGNFGDIFAGFVAQKMGLPIERLIIATNSNDILARTLATGRYEPRPVIATASPSMDIQLSSNFERLLFEAAGRDAARIRTMMETFAASGSFALSETELASIRSVFASTRIDEAGTAETITAVDLSSHYLADPHTAVGIAAARRLKGQSSEPMIVLSTAHPAKFPAAIEAATGRQPDIPARLQAALIGREDFSVIDAAPGAVRDIVAARAKRLPASAS